MTDASIETLTLKDLDQAAVTAWSQALGDPDWLLARRLEALAALGKLERPNNREEAWRFTDPKRAGLDRLPILRAGGQPTAEGAHVLAAGHADAASGGDVAGTELEPAGLVATVDGATAEAFLDPDLAAKGVILTDLATAAREHAGLVEPRLMTSAAPFDEDWFLALHATVMTAGAFLYVPRGVEVTVPVGVLQRRTTGGATFAHTLVVVEPEASLTLVQQHGSPETLDGRAFHHGVTELLVGERASVQYLSLQEWGSEQVNHFGIQRAVVGRQAQFRSFVVTLGGGVVRVSPEVVLGGRRGRPARGVFATPPAVRHRANVTTPSPRPLQPPLQAAAGGARKNSTATGSSARGPAGGGPEPPPANTPIPPNPPPRRRPEPAQRPSPTPSMATRAGSPRRKGPSRGHRPGSGGMALGVPGSHPQQYGPRWPRPFSRSSCAQCAIQAGAPPPPVPRGGLEGWGPRSGAEAKGLAVWAVMRSSLAGSGGESDQGSVGVGYEAGGGFRPSHRGGRLRGA